MFESAEIGHVIDKDTFEAEVPALREALLEAQFELQQQGRHLGLKGVFIDDMTDFSGFKHGQLLPGMGQD